MNLSKDQKKLINFFSIYITVIILGYALFSILKDSFEWTGIRSYTCGVLVVSLLLAIFYILGLLSLRNRNCNHTFSGYEKAFLFSLSLFLIVSSCAKEPYITTSIQQTSYSISAEGEITNITFSTNYAWKAVSSDSWLMVSPSSGDAGDNITIKASASENTTYSPRVATIIISVDNISQTITFNQSQNEGFVISSRDFHVGSSGGEITIPIQANIDYKCAVSEDCREWISVVQTKALSEYNLVLKIAENDNYDSRSGVINVSYGKTNETITVTQSQLDELIVSSLSFEIGSNGGDIKVPIMSNIDYSAEVLGNAGSWISISQMKTKGIEEYSLILNIAENQGYDGRVGQVRVKGANKESIVTITQFQSDAVLVNTKEYNVSAEEQIIDITVQSNVEYSYSLKDEWIHEISTKSLTSKTLSFGIQENRSFEGRVGNIVFTSTDNRITETVSIIQNKYIPKYVLDESPISLLEGEVHAFCIKTDKDEAPSEQIIWTSSNTDIAEVDNGKVTAIKEGKAVITAKGNKSGIEVSCDVVVKKEFDVLIGYNKVQERYVTFYYTPYLLKNGIPIQLSTTESKDAYITHVQYFNGHTYVVTPHKIFRDSDTIDMPNGFESKFVLSDNGELVFVGENKDRKAAILKNENVIVLSSGMNESWVEINDAAIGNGTLLIAGSLYCVSTIGFHVPVYWRNESCIIIHDTSILGYSSQEECSAVYIHNGKEYAAWGEFGLGKQYHLLIDGKDDIQLDCEEVVKVVVDDSFIYVLGSETKNSKGVPYLCVYDVTTKSLKYKVALNSVYGGATSGWSISPIDMDVCNGVAHIIERENGYNFSTSYYFTVAEGKATKVSSSIDHYQSICVVDNRKRT